MNGRMKNTLARAAAWARGIGERSRRLAARGVRRLSFTVLLASLLFTSLLIQLAQAGVGIQKAHVTPASQGNTTFQPPVDRGGRMITLPSQIKQQSKNSPTPVTPIRPSSATMQPMSLQLDPRAGAHAIGSDGRLEVTVSPGSIAPDLVAKASGALFLHIVQLAGPSGGSNSGRVTLGAYQFSLTNAHGQVISGALAKPLSLTLHLNGWRGAAFDLA
ncbi:MAG: hypothetical protein ACRDHP_14710, partial [Ktedonobacterales bacterium]